MKKLLLQLYFLQILICPYILFSQNIYVTKDGSGDRSGLTWSNAIGKKELVKTLKGTKSIDSSILIKKGEYNLCIDNKNDSEFKILCNVYGGLNGTETTLKNSKGNDSEKSIFMMTGHSVFMSLGNKSSNVFLNSINNIHFKNISFINNAFVSNCIFECKKNRIIYIRSETSYFENITLTGGTMDVFFRASQISNLTVSNVNLQNFRLCNSNIFNSVFFKNRNSMDLIDINGNCLLNNILFDNNSSSNVIMIGPHFFKTSQKSNVIFKNVNIKNQKLYSPIQTLLSDNKSWIIIYGGTLSVYDNAIKNLEMFDAIEDGEIIFFKEQQDKYSKRGTDEHAE